VRRLQKHDQRSWDTRLPVLVNVIMMQNIVLRKLGHKANCLACISMLIVFFFFFFQL
jgi:hypothetical protein